MASSRPQPLFHLFSAFSIYYLPQILNNIYLVSGDIWTYELLITSLLPEPQITKLAFPTVNKDS